MFTAADDARLGIPVVHSAYPDGEEGIQKSLAVICEKIREGAPTAAMKSFAGNMMKEAGFPQTIREQGQVVLNNIRSRAMYTPDALGTEQIQSAMVTWCVPGAPICIPIYDCDDGVCAVGTVMAALGHDVEVVRQQFGEGHQQHVLVEVRDENGEWVPLDPSSKTMPAGVKAAAQRETRHSPFDGAQGAQFVGIGALPILVWKKKKWERVGVGATLEDALADRECSCDKKEDAMTTFQPQQTYAQRVGGFGAPWPGVTSFVPQWAWLRQAWPAVDPKQRTWDETITSAYARAAAKNWIPGDSTSRSDLVALIIASAFSARAVASMPDQGQNAADALNGTWLVIAKQLGYTPETTIDQLKARVVKEQNPTTAAAEIALFELLIIVVYVAALATVYCFAIYYAPRIIDTILSRLVPFAELIYLQTQVQKIVDRHLADPNLPWTQPEKDMIAHLQDLQRGAHGAITRPPDEGPPVWLLVTGGAVIVGGVVAIIYREQIKRWLDGKSEHKMLASEARRRRRRRAA